MATIGPFHLWVGDPADETNKRTFNYQQHRGESVVYSDNSGVSSEGDNSVVIRRSQNDLVTKIRCSLAMPIVNNIGNGVYVPELIRTSRFSGEWIMPRANTDAENTALTEMVMWMCSTGGATSSFFPLKEMVESDSNLR